MPHIKHLEIFIAEYYNSLRKVELLQKENETLREYILELSKHIQNNRNEEESIVESLIKEN